MPDPATGEQNIHHNLLLATINACMFVFGVILLLMGSILPSLGVSGMRAGSLGSLPLVGILAATVFVGPLLDKLGAKPLLAAALALVVAALVVMPLLRSYAALAIAALAYGLGGGTLNTATNALVSDLSASRRSAGLNLLGFSFSLGAVTAPLLMSLAAHDSSRNVLRVLAAAVGLVLIVVLALRFPKAAHPGTPLAKLLTVLADPLVWLFGVLLFFESGNENCVFVWAGKVTGDRLQVPAQRAALALVGVSAAIGAGRLLAVLWLKRISGRTLLLASAAVTAASALLVVALDSFAGMVAAFAILGLGMSAIFPTTLGLAGDRFPHNTGTVFGAIMTVALVGGTLGPAVGGWAAGTSPSAVLTIPLVCGLAVAVLTLLIARSQPTA